ncbi:hypothetical protein [Gluconacetobacter tumulisoli]|uniref:Uncharacterized protein n=1 Tax=Gluconacetobacter tumulisoli TaxID=1286189 RepID=A0A7W4K5I9_9PROT|nr:hypothetical protein [Gluconacetobacter tumulisoli]MBB2200804.1 hypothetical protein [Gluconacetobacter tumulisoli]
MLSFLMADVQDNLGAFLTGLLAAYGWPAADIGTAIAAGGAGTVTLRLLGGWALDTLSSRRAILAGCRVVTALSVTIAALFPDVWQIRPRPLSGRQRGRPVLAPAGAHQPPDRRR